MAMTCKSGLLAGVLLAGVLPARLALADTFIRLDDFAAGELQMTGFELPRKARVQVEAVGARLGYGRDLSAYAWILDSDTRQTVWVLDRENSSRVDNESWLRRGSESLELDPGRYEVYAYATPTWRIENWGHFSGVDGVRIFLSGHHDGDDSERDYERALDKCSVTLTCADLTQKEIGKFQPTGEMAGALMQHNRLGDEEFVHTAFRLDKPMQIVVYAIVELPEEWESAADGGWIVDATTRERVWEPDHRNTRPAGGDEKNRVFRDTIQLKAGTYELYFGTDDSHSWKKFNANPPYDPPNWGITLLPGDGFDRSAFKELAPPVRKPVVDLTRARNGESLEQPFRLKREGELLVYAEGEFGDDGFADYGWIQKASGGGTVWEMTEDNTLPAGGAEKNRLFDGRVKLPAGDYVAYYVTDDSHAYRRWNSDPPYDRDAWGLTVAAGSGLRPEDIERVSETATAVTDDPNVLVRITQVRNDQHRQERFTLNTQTRIHVYALGEGVGGQMADYGWIENADNGDVVWEMTYHNTRKAGGADKNRLFDGEILLEPGTYEVHYETDDSHAFGKWNAGAPRDPRSWGITVSVVRK
jgi:hypothetical protein